MDRGPSDFLVTAIEGLASEHGVAHLRLCNDEILAAGDPRLKDHGEQRARMADFALAVQHLCAQQLAERNAPSAFTLGIDEGPAIGAHVGTGKNLFTLWGDAVRTATTMANSGLPGTIHASAAIYEGLRGHYLFQLRGHHYLDGVGEFATYLLGERQ